MTNPVEQLPDCDYPIELQEILERPFPEQLPEEIKDTYVAAIAFLERHPDVAKDDPLRERFIHARAISIVIARYDANLRERRYTQQDVIEAHDLGRRTWEAIADGFKAERDIMQQQAIELEADLVQSNEFMARYRGSRDAWRDKALEVDGELSVAKQSLATARADALEEAAKKCDEVEDSVARRVGNKPYNETQAAHSECAALCALSIRALIAPSRCCSEWPECVHTLESIPSLESQTPSPRLEE